MNTTIDFHYEPVLEAIKVCNKEPFATIQLKWNRMLPEEFQSPKTTAPDSVPEYRFSFRGKLPQHSGGFHIHLLHTYFSCISLLSPPELTSPSLTC